jgi:hypothetical protein
MNMPLKLTTSGANIQRTPVVTPGKKWLLLGVLALVACGILTTIITLWYSGFWERPPRSTQTAVLYSSAIVGSISKRTDFTEPGYVIEFDTPDEPLAVTDFYRRAFEEEGWWGDSDTGGPDYLRLQWCRRPICKEMWHFTLSATRREGITHVSMVSYLAPYR